MLLQYTHAYQNMMEAAASKARGCTSWQSRMSPLLLMLQDFANMPIDEIRLNIASRRDRIFLLMEELRRLRIQQRLKVTRRQWNQCR